MKPFAFAGKSLAKSTLLGAGLSVMLLAGCTDSNNNGQPDGVSQPALDRAIDKTVAKVENVAEKTAAKAADAAADLSANTLTTTKIKTALASNDAVRARDIDVTTQSEKKLVTLQGTVQTAAQKNLAGKIALQNAPSGYKIQNQLKVPGGAGAKKPAPASAPKKKP